MFEVLDVMELTNSCYFNVKNLPQNIDYCSFGSRHTGQQNNYSTSGLQIRLFEGVTLYTLDQLG